MAIDVSMDELGVDAVDAEAVESEPDLVVVEPVAAEGKAVEPTPAPKAVAVPVPDQSNKLVVPAGLVPVSAIQEEREKRHIAELALARFQAQAEVNAKQPEPEPDLGAELAAQLDALPDEEMVSTNMVRDLIGKAVRATVAEATKQVALSTQEAMRKEQQAAELSKAKANIAVAHERALVALSPEKTAEGFDFKSVMAAGSAHLTTGDAEHIIAIAMQGGDPAMEAYNLCIARTPELAVRQEKTRMDKAVADAIASLAAPSGLSTSKTHPSASKPSGTVSGRPILRKDILVADSAEALTRWMYDGTPT